MKTNPESKHNIFMPSKMDRGHIDEIINAVLRASDPYFSVSQYLSINNNTLVFLNHKLPIRKEGKVKVISIGKAAIPMMRAAVDRLGDCMDTGLVITKILDNSLSGRKNISLLYGNHPIPGEESLVAGRKAIAYLQGLTKEDLVIFLISGGGSALMCQPVPGVSLMEMQSFTNTLLRNQIPIQEINTLRKHLDTVKGGGLLRAALPARSLTLVLSDVVGNNLAEVASGPSVPDTTTYKDCLEIIEKYKIGNDIPTSFMNFLDSTGQILHTPKIDCDAINADDHPVIMVGGLDIALRAAVDTAKLSGYLTYLSNVYITKGVEEEAQRICKEFLSYYYLENTGKVLMLWGGEATVHRKGSNPGGRNLHMALLLAKEIEKMPGVYGATFATDGEDGYANAAGAYFDDTTVDRMKAFGIEINEAISTQNSYHAFSKLNDLIQTGPTGTNVNDLVLLL